MKFGQNAVCKMLVKLETGGNGISKDLKDELYLKENRAQGELEILNLESLINVNDVRKRLSK